MLFVACLSVRTGQIPFAVDVFCVTVSSVLLSYSTEGVRNTPHRQCDKKIVGYKKERVWSLSGWYSVTDGFDVKMDGRWEEISEDLT